MSSVSAFQQGLSLPLAPRPSPIPTRTARLRANPLRSVAAARRVARASLEKPVGSSNYLQVTSAVVLRSFLTRQAVRTIAFYLAEFRDVPSKDWLLRFDGFEEREKQQSFIDGDGSFLRKMFRAQPQEGTMVVGHPRGRFKREYKFVIEPPKVANRVLAARTQLAEEWANDLGCIRLENNEISRMAFERMFESDEKKLSSLRGRVFDFDNFSGDQTPLRFKNYMKLKLLVTQQAIARLQLYLRDTSNYDYMFLRSFIQGSHQPLVDDEKLLVELARQPPITRINPDFVIDPASLARRLMEIRSQIAQEWIAVLHGVPEEHVNWSRVRLEESLSLNPTQGEDY
jgi:hypothetical protein